MQVHQIYKLCSNFFTLASDSDPEKIILKLIVSKLHEINKVLFELIETHEQPIAKENLISLADNILDIRQDIMNRINNYKLKLGYRSPSEYGINALVSAYYAVVAYATKHDQEKLYQASEAINSALKKIPHVHSTEHEVRLLP